MIITGDSVEKLRGLPDESVHCVVTSPPYWGLRSYLPGKVKIKDNLTTEEKLYLKEQLTVLGLNGIIRL
jgi:DNA modification methylase